MDIFNSYVSHYQRVTIFPMDLGGPLCQIAKQRPAVQNCGFHWDQNSDIPRSRTTWPDLGFSDFQFTGLD